MEFTTQIEPHLDQKPEYKLTRTLFWPPETKRQGCGGKRTKGNFRISSENMPLITVVTVVFNGAENLQQTIQSVLAQTYPNIEYIVIDGGSKDGTLQILERYDSIDYWVSEPDGGIYKAMNKGVALASGEYIAFLNADDWYNPDTVASVADAILAHRPDYIFGNVDIYADNVHCSTLKKQFEQYKFNMPFGHPALFVQIQYLLIDPFDIRYKFIADYDFILGLIEKQLSYIYINKSLVNFRTGGISTVTNLNKEKFRLYYSHFGIIRAIYNYMLITNHPFIKSINSLIQTIQTIKQKTM